MRAWLRDGGPGTWARSSGGGGYPRAVSRAPPAPLGQRSAKCHRAVARDRRPRFHWWPINGAGVGHNSAPDVLGPAGRRPLENGHMDASVHPGRGAPSSSRPEGSGGGRPGVRGYAAGRCLCTRRCRGSRAPLRRAGAQAGDGHPRRLVGGHHGDTVGGLRIRVPKGLGGRAGGTGFALVDRPGRGADQPTEIHQAYHVQPSRFELLRSRVLHAAWAEPSRKVWEYQTSFCLYTFDRQTKKSRPRVGERPDRSASPTELNGKCIGYCPHLVTKIGYIVVTRLTAQ